MLVLHNGKLLPVSQSECDESGWMRGSGVFETIKTVNNNPWALSRHMRRAASSARRLGIPLPSEEEMRLGVLKICQSQSFDSGLLRIFFRHDGVWSAVHMAYEPITTDAKLISYPERVSISGQPLKTFPYDHRIEILRVAQSLGADEAIVINHEEHISEGSVTNLLLRIGDQWVTPPISDGVLPGVVRALVIENCNVLVRSVGVTELAHVKSAFLLSSLRIAHPVASIDGRDLLRSSDFLLEIQALAERTSVG